ncbi:hypothetical protein BJG92_01620 [Arthrobacter sp. SO5]|nr:hypothetical protein [Arthrobacter sp. SO5]
MVRVDKFRGGAGGGGGAGGRACLVGPRGEPCQVSHLDAEARGAVLRGALLDEMQRKPARSGVELPPRGLVHGFDHAEVGEQPLPPVHAGSEVNRADTQHRCSSGWDGIRLSRTMVPPKVPILARLGENGAWLLNLTNC